MDVSKRIFNHSRLRRGNTVMRRRTGPADWSIRYCRPLGAQGKTDVDSVSHCTRSNLIVQPSRAAVTLRFTWWSGIEATVSDLIDWPAASASTRTAGSETLLRVLDGVAGQGDVDPTPFFPRNWSWKRALCGGHGLWRKSA